MTEEQRTAYSRRIKLQEEEWKLHKECHPKGHCNHFVIKGSVLFSPRQEKVVWTHEGVADDWNDGIYDASCAVCGTNFGWWCPKSPTHYCEYEFDDWCKWCGQPEERK